MAKPRRNTLSQEAVASLRSLTDAKLAKAIDDAEASYDLADTARRKAQDEYSALQSRHAAESTPYYKALQDASSAMWEIERQLRDMRAEVATRQVGFHPGDIVEDDQGIRFRVHEVIVWPDTWSDALRRHLDAGSVLGIRLTKSGIEAHAKPRVLVSSKPFVKVDVE